MIHGLVQTAEYAALVIGGDDPQVTPGLGEQRVKLRMDRQKILYTDLAPSVTLVMEEGALLFGPDAVMAQQVDHLLSVSSRPNVEILVLPFSAGTYPRRGTFTLLDFDDAEDPSVVYVEVPMGARYFDRPADRERYEHAFNIIMRKSVPITEWRK